MRIPTTWNYGRCDGLQYLETLTRAVVKTALSTMVWMEHSTLPRRMSKYLPQTLHDDEKYLDH